MEYLKWDEKKIEDFDEQNIENMYDSGYLFTRKEKGVMQKTRSVRIDLDKFNLSSENRRILRKMDEAKINYYIESLPKVDYDWTIGKMAKDFYEKKFGKGIFTANKIKQIIQEGLNFNKIIIYSDNLGYAICFSTKKIMHYSYPFYDLDKSPKDMGLGMMTMMAKYAKENAMKYLYLGSLQRPSDHYKLQFEGLEWFDNGKWSNDLEKAKMTIKG